MRYLALTAAAALLSFVTCAAALAGSPARSAAASLARSQAALDALREGARAGALGAELPIALLRAREARADLDRGRARRAGEAARLLEARVARLELMAGEAAAAEIDRAERAAAFAAEAGSAGERARDLARALEEKGALLTSAFPGAGADSPAGERIGRAVAEGRRRAAAAEASREARAGGGDPRVLQARREVTRGLVDRARREVAALGLAVDHGAAIEEQRSAAGRDLAGAEAALGRDDFGAAQRAVERVAAAACRALLWASEVGGPGADGRRAALLEALLAAGLADVAAGCGARLAGSP